MKRSVIVILVLLSLVGLIDASYLVASHYNGSAVVCDVGSASFGECDTVLSSTYSSVAGIPVSLVGVVYYFLLLVLSSFLLSARSSKVRNTIRVISGLGVLASLYFVYLQLFVLHSICVYCMVSAVTTTVIFVLSMFLGMEEADIVSQVYTEE